MSAFLKWNDALAQHFFRPEMAGRSVYLYVIDEVIAEAGDLLDPEVDDFTAAVKSGAPWVTREGLCQQALQSFEQWRTRDLPYPPYVGYLCLFVLAAGVEGDFAPHAYYPRLRHLLGYEAGSTLPSFDRMLALWDDLEQWSTQDRAGELGIFEARIAGGWLHVGLPLAQTILTEHERKALVRIFSRSALDPTSPPADAELAALLRQHGTGHLRPRTLELLATRSDEDRYEVLLDTGC